MSINDPIGDMLTRIRNGQRANHSTVTCPASKFQASVLEVLKREGYIRNYSSKEVRKGVATLDIELKYHEGEPVIKEMRRVSKPGRRVYAGVHDIPKVYNGLGISIVSTARGVMSDHEARAANVGGEIIAHVY